MQRLQVATYNIHKGFSQFNRRMVIHELRDRLRALNPDIVFLQEVQGLHLGHGMLRPDWPGAQHEFLAEDVWEAAAYGRNAVYDSGHHGNAVLARWPILRAYNQDISAHWFESRGLLHCEVQVPGWCRPLHCVCVHLALTGGGRRRQMHAIAQRIESLLDADDALIIAGDFNDWRNSADDHLVERLGVQEVFSGFDGRPARSYPSRLPVFRLDRIYVRGFRVERAEVHYGAPWSRISDHAALTAQLAHSTDAPFAA